MQSIPSFTFILFGASGSLAQLKLFPALFELYNKGLLPAEFHVIGYARSAFSQETFRHFVAKSIQTQDESVATGKIREFTEHLFSVQGYYEKAEDFQRLSHEIRTIESVPPLVRVGYCSVPPSVFSGLLENLGNSDLNHSAIPLRLVVEKPFGHDQASSRNLQTFLLQKYSEDQLFLLDHYLGKEGVTNLLSLRYANTLLAAALNREFVQNVQITAMEKKDIEGRAGYFDPVGILRDMVQSHVLQILATLAMDLPMSETAENIHKHRLELLESIRVDPSASSLIRGQYRGYSGGSGVPAGSQTETFAALKLFVDHPLWAGVPFYIRCGKALREQWTSAVVEFKPHCSRCAGKGMSPNRVIFQIQPDQQIHFQLLTKVSGKTFDFQNLSTGQTIYCSGDCLSEYSRLISHVLTNQRDLFLDFGEIHAAWRVMDPIQKMCDQLRDEKSGLWSYEKGTLGPSQADLLMERNGFVWCNP